MTDSFLGNVVRQLKAQNPEWADLCFVLPNQRAQLFLQRELTAVLKGPLILPEAISIDDFVATISTLSPATELQQQQALYQSYCAAVQKTKQPNSFETFLGWSTPLLKDLNTIDQYLIDRDEFFKYLSSLHKIRAWGESQDSIIQDYTAFWELLPDIYQDFIQRLEANGQTTSGKSYRMATTLLENFLQHKTSTQFIFCGFNALSPSEAFIVQELLAQERAQVFWDIDKKMLEDELHQAGSFIRGYIQDWPEYKKSTFQQAHDVFHQPKKVVVTEVQQQVGQAKQIGDLLARMGEKEDWSKTAIVLADESLLMPLLYALPPSISSLNITMGFPLNQHPLAIFVNAVLKMALRQTSKGFFYADIESVLSLPETQALFATEAPDFSTAVLSKAKKEHRSYLNTSFLQAEAPKEAQDYVDMLFRSNGSPEQWIDDILKLLPLFYDTQGRLPIKQVYSLAAEKVTVLLHQIKELVTALKQPLSFPLLRNLYAQLSTVQKLNFVGAPLEGLQILGVLETRTIDFDRVLMAGVNEGILPTQTGQSSWIPYEVKKAYGLPTQDEQDAIFTYHFYRLMYRAKDVYLFYNGTTDGIQVGEPSRLIRQWAFERPPTHDWQEHTQVIPFVPPPNTIISIPKTAAVMEKLAALANTGFSPSALNLFVRDGYAFYKRYLLGLRDEDELETSFSHRTYGTLIHNCLEALYTPYVGKQLTVESCEQMISSVAQVLQDVVKQEFPHTISGKNVLALAAIERNIQNLIAQEQGEIQGGNSIEIVALEQELAITRTITGIDTTVTFKGTVDRVDKYNGQVRVLDYKTGKVTATNLGILNWDEVALNPDQGQARQLLLYAMLWNEHHPEAHAKRAGIIALKQYNKGVLFVGEKATPRGKISPELGTIQKQQTEIVFEQLIQALFDHNQPFSTPNE